MPARWLDPRSRRAAARSAHRRTHRQHQLHGDDGNSGGGRARVRLGIALGVLGTAAVTRYLETMLFGLTPLDPLTFIAVSLIFAAIAAFAVIVPARRAANVDPLIALRCQ